eukprot:10820268-Alexandrium_andersonii.AAC.1
MGIPGSQDGRRPATVAPGMVSGRWPLGQGRWSRPAARPRRHRSLPLPPSLSTGERLQQHSWTPKGPLCDVYRLRRWP